MTRSPREHDQAGKDEDKHMAKTIEPTNSDMISEELVAAVQPVAKKYGRPRNVSGQ